jgi:transposase-like protein
MAEECMTKAIIMVGMLTLTVAACSKSGSGTRKGGDSSPQSPAQSPLQNDKSNVKTDSLSFEFEINGCKTGKHVFNSRDELCKGLQNNTLNNNCAVDMRADFFQTNCPSQTFTTFDDKDVKSIANGSQRYMQMTVLNFLLGGSEQCNLKNKLFTFSVEDKKLEIPLCKNSKVKVYATSDLGVITFHATDISSGTELPPSDYSGSPRFEFGKSQEMLRYGVQNPYGFTYVLAEQVSDPEPHSQSSL